MKRIVVWIFVLSALGAGIYIGLSAEGYARKGLIDLLDGEIKASTPCHLEVGSLHVSLLRLNADAKDAAMVCDGKQKMIVKKIHASFSLAKVLEHAFPLDLDLIDGQVEGVSPDSETFKFIYYLAEPVPPERDRPDRWRVKLMNMNVSGISFVQNFDGKFLYGEGGYLSFRKGERDVITMIPGFKRLWLQREGQKLMEIGVLQAKIVSKEDRTEIEQIRLAHEGVWADIKGEYVDRTDRIEAKAGYQLATSYLQLPHWLNGAIEGHAVLSGDIDSPVLEGSLMCPLEISYPGLPPQKFPDLSASYRVSQGNAGAKVEVLSLKAENENLKIHGEKALELEGGNIAGKIDVSMDTLDIRESHFRNISGSLDLGGRTSGPVLQFGGEIGEIQQGEKLKLEGLSFNAKLSGSELEVSASHAGTEGRIDAGGKLLFPEGGEVVLQDGKITAVDYAVGSGGVNAKINGEAVVSGPLKVEGLKLDGQGTVDLPGFEKENALQAKVLMQDLNAGLNLRDRQSLLTADLKLDDFMVRKQGDLKVLMKEHAVDSLLPADSCIDVSGEFQYVFPLEKPKEGSGTLSLSSLAAGCGEHRVEGSVPATLPVKNGSIGLSKFLLRSGKTSLDVDGSISVDNGYDLKAGGSLDLEIFLPFVPSFDDLGGKVDIHAGMQGHLDAPLFNGNASLMGGHFSIASENLAASSIRGSADLQGGKLMLSDVKGEVNGGDVGVEGYLVPVAPERSELSLKFDKVVLEPVADLIVIASGALKAGASESGANLLRGSIDIDSAEYQKNIDLRGMLSLFTNAVFGRKEVYEATVRRSGDLNLDLQITGLRNMFIFTNWFGAELAADISVAGTVAQPVIRGGLSVLSGWLGFRSRRFVVNEGKLAFEPPSPIPYLDLVAETKLYSSVGNPVTVVLESRGPLNHPAIELASDQGLAQQDIFTLLATGQGAQNPTVVDSVGRSLEPSTGVDLASFIPFLPVPGFLSELTRIDNFYVEPELDPATGLVEPVAIATKNLTNRFTAIGEIGLGETRSRSRASLVYDLTPRLNIAGILDAGNPNQKTAVGIDLRYTVYSRLGQAVKITIEGNQHESETELIKALKLNEAVSMTKDNLPGICGSMKDFYVREGFREAKVTAECSEEANGACAKVTFKIDEGPRFEVEGIIFDEADVEHALGDKLPAIEAGKPATTAYLEDYRACLVNALRNEGYISSRIETQYAPGTQPGKLFMGVTSFVGKPVTFVFEGNTRFTPREFLDTINLFNRRIPFGRNTANLLVENMVLLYRRAGYLYAAITKDEREDPETGRIIYTIRIDEGKKIPVAGVRIEGNTSFSEDEIRSAIEETEGDKAYQDMFSPEYAVSENIQSHADSLRNWHISQGYPQASVETRVEKSDKEDEVNIRYIVIEGVSKRQDWIHLHDVPPDVVLPEKPPAPYSLEKADEYMREVTMAFNDAAYMSPVFKTSQASDNSPIEVNVMPGEKTYIAAIDVSGNVRVPDSSVLDDLSIHPGDPWSPQKIQENKLRLLRLGLFSKVSISEEAVSPVKRKVLFNVKERPMQELQVGTGLNSEYGLHFFAEGTDRELFKDGRSLSLRVDAYYDSVSTEISQGSANLRYLDPAFLYSDFSFAEDVGYIKQQLSTQEFDLDRVSLSTSFYRVASSGLTFSAGHTIFQDNLSDVSPGSIISPLDFGVVTLSSLGSTLRYDQRDSALIPKKGYLLTLDSTLSSHAIGSDANYFAASGRASYLLPLQILNNRFGLALASRVGSAWTFDHTSEVPITQRFYAGGRTTVRGFRENGLGPTGVTGSVIGGDFLSVSNVQLNYYVTDSLSVHTFLDAGNVYLKERGIDLGDLRKGTGLGAEYFSPIGPVGIDIGFPIDREPGESTYRFYFTVGTMF